MNYLQWNDAIIKHFFNEEKEEKEVTLYFSKIVINEIGKETFEEPEYGYYENFLKALRMGVPGANNSDYIQRILYLDEHYKKGCRSINGVQLNYPPYLSYLLAFILPFTSGESLQGYTMANFHGIAKGYFEDNNLTKNYTKYIENRLKTIDYLWNELSDWLIEENNFSLGYIENITDPNQNRKYVSKFEYHILFRKEQEERLPKVFDDNNILPDDNLSYDIMKELLINHSSYLKISDNTKEKIASNDYIGNKIVKRALRFYNNWTGAANIIDNYRANSRKKLILCLDYNVITNNIKLKYLRAFSKDPLPENSEIKSKNGVFKVNISQRQKYYSEPIENCFIDLNTRIDLKDETNKIKYTWIPKDLLLFKRINQFDWVEIPKVEFNVGRTLIICKKEFYAKNLEEWFVELPEYNKKLLENSKTELSYAWIIFWVDNLATYPLHNIPQLNPDTSESPRINFSKEIYRNGNLYKDKLPDVWIENMDNSSPIIARYKDGLEIELQQKTSIEIDTDGCEITIPLNLFSFKKEHINRTDQEFKLICNDIETFRYLRIVDFEKVNNAFIDTLLPMRDSIGQITEDSITTDYVKGIEHFFTDDTIKKVKPHQSILELENVGFINNKEAISYKNKEIYNEKHLGNILINYLSTTGRLSYYDFQQVITFLLESSEKKERISEIVKNISFRLQDLGFIDYDERNSRIIVNKPHLVIKPTPSGLTAILTGARDNIFIKDIHRYCQEEKIVIDSKYEFSELFPQVIHLKFKNPSDIQLLELAEKFDIVFKKNGLYTQVALPYFFPDLKDWKNYFKHDINAVADFEGGLIFNIESLNFINKPIDFNKNLSLVKFTGISGYKTIYYLWYNQIPYNVNSQSIGIYLFLYLYGEKREKALLDKKEGWRINKREIENEKKITYILVYDTEKNYLAVPINCSLPLYFSQSISLLSGSQAEKRYLEIKGIKYKGSYLIYKNIPSLFIKNVLRVKLNQSLNYSEINL
ncbi:MAG: hypothetical protein PHO58_04800 [Bacilli bacterium]|nr:hypothetical protein [Bacilli bacterium]